MSEKEKDGEGGGTKLRVGGLKRGRSFPGKFNKAFLYSKPPVLDDTV